MEWEKIFTNHKSGKWSVSKISETHVSQQQKVPPNPIEKWADDLSRLLCKEDTQTANRYLTKCSISLIIIKMHIKIGMRHCLRAGRMAFIKKTGGKACW